MTFAAKPALARQMITRALDAGARASQRALIIRDLLCLYGLDWLMELWSTLYLAPDRDQAALAIQAEWQARLLPALAAQMHARDQPLPPPGQP